MTKFSDEQQIVIDEKERNLLVSASAGSGKTTVMIERIVKLIKDGKTKLNRILVLTFTNNSANDMKEKLYKRLSESTNKNCKEALFDIATANISNIHQFCKRLIQKYFFVCNVDPAFSVISESEALVLKDRALDKTIEEFFYQKQEGLDAFLENNFEKRNFSKVKEMILTLFTFLSILDDPEGWIKNFAVKNYDEKARGNYAVKILFENAKFVLNHYIGEFGSILSHVKRFFNLADFEHLTNLQNNLTELVKNDDIESFINQTVSFVPKCKRLSKNEDVKVFHEENIKPLFEEFKKDFEKVQQSFGASSVTELEKFLKSNKASGEFLCELAKKFIEEYQKIKEEKFLLDFDDLEAKAKLLLDDDRIRDEIRSCFDYCFVDEYQDINILQESIIGSISKNSFYFGVGDAKQAIYGFRLCSPEIFISKFLKYKNEPEKNLATALNKNFRSKINILRFANKVFDVIMTKQTANIDYKNEARFQSSDLDNKPKVKINVVISEKSENENLPEVYSVKNHVFEDEDEIDARIEAELAYREITKIIQGGAKYSDIAILARNKDTNSFVKAFFDSLQKKNVPIIASFRTNLLTYKEISLIHNIIKLIENFKDDVVLYKVLTFPFFGFSINRLLEIRNGSNEKTFADCFLSKRDEGDIKKFLEFYEKIKLLEQNMSVLEFAQYLMQVLIDSVAKEIQSENVFAHFESYFDFIKQINPSSTTEYVKLTEGENLESSSAQNSKDNAVVFCTIHSSKGLEYKHVILIGCGKKLNLNNKDEVLIEENIGIGIKGFDENEEKKKTPIYNAIKITSKTKNFAEEIRLLYVALTRAKESLTIIGTISNKSFEKLKTFKNDFEILKTENYLELILKSFSSGEISKLQSSRSVNIVYEKNEVANCEAVFQSEIKQTNCEEEKKQHENQEDVTKAVETWRKLTNVKNVYLKNSVSSIMKSQTEDLDYSNHLSFGEENSSAMIGTRYHEEFSKLDFKENDLSKKIPSDLNEKYFKMFFDSDLYSYCKNKKINKELPFLFYDTLPERFGFGKEKVLLQGIIDLLVFEDDGFVVVGYKASSGSDEELRARYKAQLDLYSYCAERILNKKCKKKLIYKIFVGKTVEIE